MNTNEKNIEAISECISEAERYLAKCKKLKQNYEKLLPYGWSPNMHNSAVLRAGVDLRRVMSRFARRNASSNYNKEWSEVD